MKTFICYIAVLFLLNLTLVRAQSPFVKPNTAYFELFGSGGLYSVNYERFLIMRPKTAYGIRVGGGFWNRKEPNFNTVAELVALTGIGKHHADFGLGLVGGFSRDRRVPFPDYQRRNHLYAVPRIGYRYQKPEGGTMIRFGITPFVAVSSQSPSRYYSYPLYVGLSVGQSF